MSLAKGKHKVPSERTVLLRHGSAGHIPGAPGNQDQKTPKSIALLYPSALVTVVLSRKRWQPGERSITPQCCDRDRSPQDGSLCRQVAQDRLLPLRPPTVAGGITSVPYRSSQLPLDLVLDPWSSDCSEVKSFLRRASYS